MAQKGIDSTILYHSLGNCQRTNILNNFLNVSFFPHWHLGVCFFFWFFFLGFGFFFFFFSSVLFWQNISSTIETTTAQNHVRQMVLGTKAWRNSEGPSLNIKVNVKTCEKVKRCQFWFSYSITYSLNWCFERVHLHTRSTKIVIHVASCLISAECDISSTSFMPSSLNRRMNGDSWWPAKICKQWKDS